MALDNYANLKAAIVRADGSNDITDILDDAIVLCETEMFAIDNPLRIQDMEVRTTASTTTSSRFVALPDNFLESRRLRIQLTNYHKDLRYRSPSALTYVDATGIPHEYTITSQIELDRVPDAVYTLEYQFYQKPTPLSSSNATNAVLTSYPTIYLMGCLWAVNHVYHQETDVAANYYAKFMDAIDGANKRAKRTRIGAMPAIKMRVATP